ncbi:mitochondrial distribution and morphology protein 31 [[Candida] anglica]|uniref:Mitochondrial distribution and morphology protein 31 n=1 Tax=[Candida] anglica TaxID=148631 RepID=A0ABP0EER5_9ASCO
MFRIAFGLPSVRTGFITRGVRPGIIHSSPQNIYQYSKITSGIILNRRLFHVSQPQHNIPPSSNEFKNLSNKSSTNTIKQPSTPDSIKKPEITKSLLLAQTSNGLSRLLIHIKWPLTRNNRPFSADDFSAFASWVVMGNLLWIILGTTTFVLFGMYLVDMVKNVWELFQKDNQNSETKTENIDDSFLGRITGSILSNGLGLKVEFQNGSVLPELHDGMLRFRNINVSTIETSNDGEEEDETSRVLSMKANIDQMDVSLSFGKWYEGKGLIEDLELYGMNCKVYKQSSKVDGEEVPMTNNLVSSSSVWNFGRYNESANFHISDDLDQETQLLKDETKPPVHRKFHIDPDYTLNHFKIHDSFIEIFDTEPKKSPLRVTIFNCDLPGLRGNRLLIDFFNANNVTGAINDSMFTIHKHQKLYNNSPEEEDTSDKMVRFKLDGIDLGSISRTNPSSKFNWIVNGRAQIIADIVLPQDKMEPNFNFGNEYKKFTNMFSEAINELTTITTSHSDNTDHGIGSEPSHIDENIVDKKLLKSALAALYDTFQPEREEGVDSISEYVVVNFKIKLYDLKASLPQQLPCASTTSSPFISLHNLRTLIAFVNHYFDSENKPPITIKTTVIEKLSELSHASNLSETKILDLIFSDIYEDLNKMVQMEEKRIINERSSMWSHSLASQLLLLGLGVIA